MQSFNVLYYPVAVSSGAEKISINEDEFPTSKRCENNVSLDEPDSSLVDDLTSEHGNPLSF